MYRLYLDDLNLNTTQSVFTQLIFIDIQSIFRLFSFAALLYSLVWFELYLVSLCINRQLGQQLLLVLVPQKNCSFLQKAIKS